MELFASIFPKLVSVLLAVPLSNRADTPARPTPTQCDTHTRILTIMTMRKRLFDLFFASLLVVILGPVILL